MNEQDYNTIKAMEQYGGSFVKALAETARHADPINLEKLKRAFPMYWEHYEQFRITSPEIYEWKYDPHVKAGYITLSDKPVEDTVALVEGKVMLDKAKDGTVVGVEIIEK